MAISHSKLTSQGQISVPADIRRKLGLVPGSILEWDEEGDRIVVRRAGRYTFEDIHEALFGSSKPKSRTLEELKEGIGSYIRGRDAHS